MLAGRPAISVWIICLLSNRIISFRYFTRIILLAAFCLFRSCVRIFSFLLFSVLTVPVGALVPWEVVASVSAREVMPAGWLAGWLCTFYWLASSLANLSPSLTGCSLAQCLHPCPLLAHRVHWHPLFTGTTVKSEI